jgi:hypothetical protein
MPCAYLTSFSSISFASLTLVARYGEPPRSGWLSSMSDRCFLRRSSFVMPRSLSFCQYSIHSLLDSIARRTASPESRPPPAVSSWAQSRPCRNFGPVRTCQRRSCVSRRAQRDPGSVSHGAWRAVERRTKKAPAPRPRPHSQIDMVAWICGYCVEAWMVGNAMQQRWLR